MADEGAASLPYHEPSIVQILILSSFFLALNAINSVLDRTLYCGLIGQVFIGIAWGTPGGKWLSAELENAIVQVGYLGLILIVYEGGASTSIPAIKANLALSTCVALTGVAAPMGLSFLLGPMVGATGSQCFAAGAALCATSLGTTFTVLATSGLTSTRLGSVLSTAAMMDDVVGLVMVQIVSSLGPRSTELQATTVVRPVFVSLAFAIVVPFWNRFLLRPVMRKLDRKRTQHPHAKLYSILQTEEASFIVHTGLLLALVVGASYAGASVLLAAYLSGIMVCWWDTERTGPKSQETDKGSRVNSTRGDSCITTEAPAEVAQIPQADNSAESPVASSRTETGKIALESARHTGPDIYEQYYSQALHRVLKPSKHNEISGKILAWASSSKPRSKASAPAQPESTQTSASITLANLDRAQIIPEDQTDTHTTSSSMPAKPVSLYPSGIISLAMVARGEIGFLISAVAESNDFRLHTEEYNLSQVERTLDKSLVPYQGQLETVLVVDADRTLAAEESGTLFGERVSDSQQRGDEEHLLKTLFGGTLDYSYTAFRQAALLYEETADGQQYEALCQHVASAVTTHSEFLRSSSRLGEGLSKTVKVIAGGRIADGFVVTAAVKAALVARLQDIHQVAVVVVGDERIRSKIMDAALSNAIDRDGLQALQVALPSNASPQLNATKLPFVHLIGIHFISSIFCRCNRFAGLQVFLATGRNAAKLLATPMRDAAVAGPALREAYCRVGWYLASAFLTRVIGVEECQISHVPGRRTTGYYLLHE
ncbi:hypothetical protein DL765_001879 [Monosporascus sp. GIB2]|nr:hypothetical protein DL765_001879 [Monosporascus sp. GIB2]